MRKICLILSFIYFSIFPAWAQVTSASLQDKSARGSQAAYSKHQREVMEAQTESNSLPEVKPVEKKYKSNFMKSGTDQKTARNIMIVREVSGFKIGDEQLSQEIAALEDNREYEQKMQRIRDQLSNDKRRNSKNQEIIRILNEAGNKIYNLLAN